VKRAWLVGITIILLFVSSAFIPCVGGQEEGEEEHITLDWIRQVGYQEDDGNVTFDSIAQDIIMEDDGSFLITAMEPSNQTLELIKTNGKGKTIWNRRYELKYNETVYNLTFNNENTTGILYLNLTWYTQYERWTGKEVISTSDGNYTIIGTHYYETYNQPSFTKDGSMYFVNDTRLNESHRDNIIYKINVNGTIVWEMTLDQIDDFIGLAEMDNGDIEILGIDAPDVNNTNNSSPTMLLLKLDKNGKEIFTKTLDMGSDVLGEKMLRTTDDKIVILGSDIDFSYIWLIKIDSSGKEIWKNKYPNPSGNPRAYISPDDIIEDNNGGFFISALEDPYLDGDYWGTIAWVFRIDSGGNEVWRATFSDFSFSLTYFSSMVWTSAEELMCFGTVELKDTEMILYKLDSNGTRVWNISFEGPGTDEYAIKIFDLGNGTYSLFSGGDSILLLKTNKDPTLNIDHDEWYDAFEYETFGNLDETPDSDADGDGFTNQEELDEGTDPTNEHDYPGQEETVNIILVIMGVVLFLALILVIFLLLRRGKETDENQKGSQGTEVSKDTSSEEDEKKPEAAKPPVIQSAPPPAAVENKPPVEPKKDVPSEEAK